MFKPDYKDVPHGELIKENETVTLFSVFDFAGGVRKNCSRSCMGASN